ncbi:MAG: 30S ribosomal protein S21 [Spirochaetota bacterium]|nr:30S ribosomal protein S21 [Spirochaetota bacterium]
MTRPLEVEVNGDIERAFKNLKKKMAYEGIFKELKRRRYYEKPSVEKKRKKEEAERRRLKKLRRFNAHNQNRRFVNPRTNDQRKETVN